MAGIMSCLYLAASLESQNIILLGLFHAVCLCSRTFFCQSQASCCNVELAELDKVFPNIGTIVLTIQMNRVHADLFLESALSNWIGAVIEKNLDDP